MSAAANVEAGEEVAVAAGCLVTFALNVTFGPNGAIVTPTPGVWIR
jgi:hypothetical protein